MFEVKSNVEEIDHKKNVWNYSERKIDNDQKERTSEFNTKVYKEKNVEIYSKYNIQVKSEVKIKSLYNYD